MGFFDRRAKTLTDDELRDTLFDAATGSNPQDLQKLLESHMPRVIALFPTWTTLPPSVRSDPAQMTWWAEGMIGVASAATALGEGSLMAQIQGPPEQNILVQWRESLLASEADATNGDYSSAIRRLEQILEDVNGLKGQGVDQLLPQTYGLLGSVHYRAGHRDQARQFTLMAKDYCERMGDPEGTEIYARNLSIIDAV
ncbi:MAG TPA: hypothetical protein VFO58_09625 [Vicinamibacterales bacterium]|nr:hypothetical protein [Vicinamibacterales bacterium]